MDFLTKRPVEIIPWYVRYEFLREDSYLLGLQTVSNNKYLSIFRFFKKSLTDGKSTRPNVPEQPKLLPCVTLVMMNKL